MSSRNFFKNLIIFLKVLLIILIIALITIAILLILGILYAMYKAVEPCFTSNTKSSKTKFKV